jgi:heptosyltransferase III
VHILIIRPGAIGDMLLTFPILHALKTQYDQPQITLVGNPAVLPLAIAWQLVEEVEDYGALKWSELFSTQGIQNTALKKQLAQANLAVCWMRDPDGIVAQNLHVAGVKHVIVAPGKPPQGRRIHVVDYLAETLSINMLQGAEVSHRVGDPLWGRGNGVDEEWGPSLPYVDQPIAIHPGSGGAQKCWPVSSFAAIIQYLWQHNYPVLLLAGPADHERMTQLQKLLVHPPQAEMLHILLDAPLLEVAQVLQQCRYYLGNDAGITHLAAMLGLPTMVLFGPSDPTVWRPLGPSVEVVHQPILAQLPVEIVIEHLKQRL